MADALFRRLAADRFQPTDLARGPWTRDALHEALTFIKPDLTISLHRLPVGEWMCLDATSRLEPHGVGLAESALFDEQGPLGQSIQSLLVEARG